MLLTLEMEMSVLHGQVVKQILQLEISSSDQCLNVMKMSVFFQVLLQKMPSE